MESSPLILAHDHARAASIATQSGDTTVAINEHALAAGEFAKAAAGTGSAEALRTLRLLELQHQRMSEILRFPTENASTTASGEPEVNAKAEKPLSTSAAVAELRASKSDLGPRSASPLRTLPNLPRRLPPRDLSSSIATNLASARGIRTHHTRQPLSPSISNHQAPGSLESLPRRDGKQRSNISPIPEHGQPSWLPPSQLQKSPPQVGTSRAPLTAASEPTAQDEGFSRFYGVFENILHKISAPLAFAGLPLGIETDGAKSPEPEPSPLSKRPRPSRVRSGDGPDLSNISQAALRASARDGHSGTDSFYVVPTSGQTVSYAQILSFAEKEKRRMAASMYSNIDNDEDDFVDARETPMPPTPSLTPSTSRLSKSRGKINENRLEELTVENHFLKGTINELSKRVQAFELGAQSSSMALQESIRLMRDMSPARDHPVSQPSSFSRPILSRDNSQKADDVVKKANEAMERRLKELEEQVKDSARDMEKLGKENDKLRSVVARYRDRWEQLKESAKTRRGVGVSKENGEGKDGEGRKESEAGAS